MNKKQQSSNKRRKRASIGLAVCFAAAIVLTGAYTWRNYRANVKDEQAKIEEEQQAKEEEIKRNTEETSSIAKKALEDEEPVTKEDSQAANTAADGSTAEPDGYLGDGQHADRRNGNEPEFRGGQPASVAGGRQCADELQYG